MKFRIISLLCLLSLGFYAWISDTSRSTKPQRWSENLTAESYSDDEQQTQRQVSVTNQPKMSGPSQATVEPEEKAAEEPKQNPDDLINPFVPLLATDGLYIAMGDILVPETALVSDELVARFDKVRYWESPEIPFEVDSGLDRGLIESVIHEFAAKTNVRLVPREYQEDFIYFAASDKKRCLSFLGKQGGRQEIFLHPKACVKGSIIHEVMHALGFIHEHSRFDRDDFVTVHWNQIEDGFQSQFQLLPGSVTRPFNDSPFDFDSIMLYPSDAFSPQGQSMTKKGSGEKFSANRAGLSKADIDRLLLIYPKPPNEEDEQEDEPADDF